MKKLFFFAITLATTLNVSTSVRIQIPCVSNGLQEALDSLRLQRQNKHSTERAQIEILGKCSLYPQESIDFSYEDSNIEVVAKEEVFISGGTPIDFNTDAEYLDAQKHKEVLALLPEAAKAEVKVFSIAPGTFGQFTPIGAMNDNSQLQLSRASSFQRGGLFFSRNSGKGTASALGRLAQFPNKRTPGKNQEFLKIKKKVNEFFAEVTPTNRTRKWEKEMLHNRNVWAFGYWSQRWADAHYRLLFIKNDTFAFDIPQLGPATDRTVLPCAGDCMLGPQSEFFVYNLLSELDEPGEYVVDVQGGLVFAWPPRDTDGNYLKAHIAFPDRDAVINVNGAHNVTFRNVHVRHSAAAGVRLVNATNIAFTASSIAQVNTFGFNVTGGANCSLTDSQVSHVGVAAVVLEGGDRVTLTPGGHAVSNSEIFENNVIVESFSPGIVLAGVGNEATNNSLRHGPGHAVWFQGNDHRFVGNVVEDYCWEMDDAAAVYSGRDFSYHGNVISRNTFRNIFTRLEHPALYVQAIYLDDRVSGFTITNNTFHNVSQMLLLGGGREHLISGNVIVYDEKVSQVAKHTRQMIWIDQRGYNGKRECSPNDIPVKLLARVPYQTPLWQKKYGTKLPNILQDDCALAYYNRFVGNCLVTDSEIPYSNFDVAQLNSSLRGDWLGNMRVRTIEECHQSSDKKPFLRKPEGQYVESVG